MASIQDWLLFSAQTASWVLAAGLSVLAVYMLALVVGSWLYTKQPGSHVLVPAFAVLIPAHDEEAGIVDTVARLREVAYPAQSIRIIVIADNCTDQTGERARAAGAEVWERRDQANRGKGQALDWALKRQAGGLAAADLIAFVDADMQVHPRFFAEMAAAFADARLLVAQARYVISSPSRSVLSAIGFASFCYVNHVRPAGRCFWGGTADLKGGGMVFKSGFLLPRGWPAHSIAEDIELGKELMLEGVGVEYVPAAQVLSEIPSTLAQVKVQQTRWEGGRRSIHAAMLRRAAAALLRRPSRMLLDGVLDLLVPPLSMVLLMAVMAIALAVWSGSASGWFSLASLVVFGIAVLSGLLQNRASWAVYARLAAAPLFVAWKIMLLIRIRNAAAPSTWQRTPRAPSRDKAAR